MQVQNRSPLGSDKGDVVAAGSLGIGRAGDLLSEPSTSGDRDDRVADVVRDERRHRDLAEPVAGIERGEARSLTSDVC